jgi:hypothetical protein
MTQSNQLTTPNDRLLAFFDGIFLGRTLHDLEKQAGASIEDLLKAVRADEDAFLGFKAAREWGTYVQESELTTRLRENADNPESAVKTNALKLYADHMHWSMERANPNVYSGKLDVSAVMSVKINTQLDLNAVKRIDNVYDLTATVTEARPAETLSDSDAKLLEASATPATTSSPFDTAVTAASQDDRAEEASERLFAAIDRALAEDMGDEDDGGAPAQPEAVGQEAPRPKPRRQRRVVRSKQALVEQSSARETARTTKASQ